MSLLAFRKGHRIKIGIAEFAILQRLPGNKWQLQNTATGEWCTFEENDLLDRFARNELSFVVITNGCSSPADGLAEKLVRDLSTYPSKLVDLARTRLQYLKEIDKQQPIAITQKAIEPLVRNVSETIKDISPPSWRTVCRDYRKWLATDRDIRAIIRRSSNQGRKRCFELVPAMKAISDQVIEELYMTIERRRVPEVYLEIVRRLNDANRFRPATDKLPIPSRRTIYREIARRTPYEVMVARHGKRRAQMEFRVATVGPQTSRALERVVMDHTLADIIVVDDKSMLPLGRPTITSALDEHTRCLMGFYTGFEPPSCLAVMRCLKHAILPKTYLSREFPSIKNRWECYGVPEVVVVDNPPEFHSKHFERACLQIGIDVQYAKVRVPWYKGKLERFQGTMNHDLLHGKPGTTFANILERDDYDPTKHAVVMLSTLREILHKWVVDIYLQTPHRGIKDIPAQRWQNETSALPPPLPPSADALDIVLGMAAQRVVFHYGIELEGVRYNSRELGELRRSLGTSPKVELTYDPGDLGHINVLDSQHGRYIQVLALDQSYAVGLSVWQNRVIRRYTQQHLNGRTDIVALAQAKAEIRALVERDFLRKSTRGRKRHVRFLGESSNETFSNDVNVPSTKLSGNADRNQRLVSEVSPVNDSSVPKPSYFTDDEILPVFETDLDLPRKETTKLLGIEEGSND